LITHNFKHTESSIFIESFTSPTHINKKITLRSLYYSVTTQTPLLWLTIYVCFNYYFLRALDIIMPFSVK